MRYNMIETIWHLIGVSFIITLVTLFVTFIVSEKKINGYYLGSQGQSLILQTDIEYCQDYSTLLTGMTLEEAVELVNELNDTLDKEQQ